MDFWILFSFYIHAPVGSTALVIHWNFDCGIFDFYKFNSTILNSFFPVDDWKISELSDWQMPWKIE